MAIDRNLLKTDSDIVKLLEKNQSFEEEMNRSIRLLGSDIHTQDFDKAKAACLKAFGAIVDGIKVFFSFVGSDSGFAFALLDALIKQTQPIGCAANRLFPICFIAAVYSQQILDALRRTHWMFVVVPSDEAGIRFRRL
jgi:hypothetical protein